MLTTTLFILVLLRPQFQLCCPHPNHHASGQAWPQTLSPADKLGGELAEDAARGPPASLAMPRRRGWGHTVGQILLVPHLSELPSVEGASTGDTPGEVSSVWGSTTAADVVGGGGGDRDTLGGCAMGKEVGAKAHVRNTVPPVLSARSPCDRVGNARAEAAITEDTDGRD